VVKARYLECSSTAASTRSPEIATPAGERLLLPIDEMIVQDLNRYLRGWAGYFRYGNSARHFNLIEHHAHNRLALFVAKRHQRSRACGWRVVTYSSPKRLGLISLSGTVVAPRPHRAWKG
jgi:RNA-directed DNA polymerase